MRWILFLILNILFIQISVAPVITQEQVYDQRLQWQENHRVAQLKAKIDTSEFTPELLYQALVIYVQDPDIVFNQSKIESGWWTSPLFLKHNNPFGMKYAMKRETTSTYRARIGKIKNYAGYSHWSDAVKDVALWQQYWKVKGKEMDDYYKFLHDLPYATAKRYIPTLKSMEV